VIDIHCHILPGFDDGPATMQESLRMAEAAAADGVTHIVATPHLSCGSSPAASDAEKAVSMLRDEVQRHGIGTQILPGADLRLTFELLGCIGRGEVPTINRSRYFLLELPEILPRNLEAVFFAASTKGYVPVITHPERNYGLLSAPDRMERLRDSGCLFQLTAMSLTGEFGPEICDFGLQLVKTGLCDFIASDAHDPSYRTTVLSGAYGKVRRLVGDDAATRLFCLNPKAVIDNAGLLS